MTKRNASANVEGSTTEDAKLTEPKIKIPREKNKTVDFEKKINALEKIVEDMEKGSLSLEESLKFFEDGIKITRECQQALRNAELKVEILTADSNKLEKFDGEVT